MKWFKWGFLSLIAVLAFGGGGMYFVVIQAAKDNLPQLDGNVTTSSIKNRLTLSRDQLGQAVLTAKDKLDVMYGLGYAHGQDRFFQMDVLRRTASGRLSQLLGRHMLQQDVNMRFHQFYHHSRRIYQQLSPQEQQLLTLYSKGVNEALMSRSAPFEYTALFATPEPWQPADSLLVIYSMYYNLQRATIIRDQTLLHVKALFGQPILDFILQPSDYQVALDDSQFPQVKVEVPTLPITTQALAQNQDDPERIKTPETRGSNNWAVSGDLTDNGQSMLSDDMHLGLSVPSTWYRAQLNYIHHSKSIQVTGVTLPGIPAVVVGSNNHIAWGFTNSMVDTADWIELDKRVDISQKQEKIPLSGGDFHTIEVKMSRYGPVKQFNGKSYALSWVAHQDYGANLKMADMAEQASTFEALKLADHVGIPAQNMVVADVNGDIAWRLLGAFPARSNPTDTALLVSEFSDDWRQNQLVRPQFVNPQHGRIWTANARVVSTDDYAIFGDGSYALGARSQQIRQRLFEKDKFTQQDFYQLQLDNEAIFLDKWQKLLLTQLEQANRDGRYQQDIELIKNWQRCACADSIGYTLVSEFKFEMMSQIWSKVAKGLEQHQLRIMDIHQYLESASWQIIEAKRKDWFNGHDSLMALSVSAYQDAKGFLSRQMGDDINNWRWGMYNQLTIQHPLSRVLPFLSEWLDMPTHPGSGGSHMPAIQGMAFGASQRFIVQPGQLEDAIMTVAGGQSGNPESIFYRAGFDQYVNAESTPLLPGKIIHTLSFSSD